MCACSKDAYPDIIGSENSGYSLAFGYTNLSEGAHTITFRAISKSGDVAESIASFIVEKCHKPFILSTDTVSISSSSITKKGPKGITINDMLIDGRFDDLDLDWSTATQDFDTTRIERSP